LSGFSSVPAITAPTSRRPSRRAGRALWTASEASRRPRRRPATRSTMPLMADKRARCGWWRSRAIRAGPHASPPGDGGGCPRHAEAPCPA
jgi:hypothetical protein